MLHPAVMISNFLESHALSFVLQFCSRSFLCPLPAVPRKSPTKRLFHFPVPNRSPLSVVSNWYQTRPLASIWNHALSFLNQYFSSLFHTDSLPFLVLPYYHFSRNVLLSREYVSAIGLVVAGRLHCSWMELSISPERRITHGEPARSDHDE